MAKKILLFICILAAFLYFKSHNGFPPNPPNNADIIEPNEQSLPANNNAQSPAVSGGNYLKNAANSKGQIIRWNKNHIKFYIVQNGYYNIAKAAVDEWQKGLDGYVKFSETDSIGKCDILIEFVSTLDRLSTKESYKLGLTSCNSDGKGYLARCTISLLPFDPNTKKAVPAEQMQKTIIHEFGHALGISGHSPNKNDIMYPAYSSTIGLSLADLNTVKLMYSNDKSLVQKHLAGASSEKLAEAENYAKQIPDKAIGWINLGKTYYDNKHYSKAVDAYAKALSLDPGDATIYMALSSCYLESKNYSAAIQFSTQGLEKNPDPTTKAALYHIAGVSYASVENYKKALPYFKNAVSYDKNNKAYNINVIVASVHANQPELGVSYLRSYLNDNPQARNDEDFKELIKWARL